MQGRYKGALPVSGKGQDVAGIHSHRCYGIAQAPGTGERVQDGQDQVDGVCDVLIIIGCRLVHEGNRSLMSD